LLKFLQKLEFRAVRLPAEVKKKNRGMDDKRTAYPTIHIEMLMLLNNIKKFVSDYLLQIMAI